jgi:hypothetical protein
MFEFRGSPVPVRDDVVYAHRSLWHHVARPGPTLTGEERVRMLEGARADDPNATGLSFELGRLATELYHRPVAVKGDMVRAAADRDGDPMTVEVLALVSMLSAIDGTHRALGVDLEPLPEPVPGDPTGHVAEGLKRRRTHIPVPPGPIPVMFDLLPMEGAVFQSLFGPHYMTGWEMALDTFERRPGLNRAQMELVSSRTSMHNECFY